MNDSQLMCLNHNPVYPIVAHLSADQYCKQLGYFHDSIFGDNT